MAIDRQRGADAQQFVRKRMVGFEKDMDICLCPRPHPEHHKPTIAFSPAIGTCCATLELLTSLYCGHPKGASDQDIEKFCKKYRPDYDAETIAILFAFRHAIAHRGIVNGVFILRHRVPDRRVGWNLTDSNAVPAVRLDAQPGTAHDAPWPCSFDHTATVNIGRLWRDIRHAAFAYAEDLGADQDLLRNLVRCLECYFPRSSTRPS